MSSFTYCPAISDMNIILSEGLFSHGAAHLLVRHVCFFYFKMLLVLAGYGNMYDTDNIEITVKSQIL